MTSNHHAPYVLGDTRATMAVTEGGEGASRSETLKAAACTKPELLVIADQNAAVNAFPGLVHTARHTMEAGGARSRSQRLPKAKPVTGVKS